MTKVLVTGASSQIGLYVVSRLASAGIDCVAVSRNTAVAQRNAHRLGLKNAARWIEFDLLQPREIPEVGLLTVLIHAAPLYALPPFLATPAGSRIKRIAAFSSTSIEGKKSTRSTTEGATIGALQTAEEFLRQWSTRAQNRALVLRPTLVYGAGMDRNVTRIARFISRYGFFPLFGSGRGLRQPVHAQDLAEAAVSAIYSVRERFSVLNFCGGETITYVEMVRRIFSALLLTPRVLHLPAAPIKTFLRFLEPLGLSRGLTADMISRIDEDLVFDDSPARERLGYAPRGFQPTKDELGV